jgi:hypothetical protein
MKKLIKLFTRTCGSVLALLAFASLYTSLIGLIVVMLLCVLLIALGASFAAGLKALNSRLLSLLER